MENRIFISLPIAAAIHILEEYVFPGGFIKSFNKLMPRASHLFTPGFHIVVNGIFFILCLFGAFVGRDFPVFGLSIFGLIFTNAILHIRGAIIQRGYYPGVISGIFIYIPITIYAYYFVITGKQLPWTQAILSFFLGVFYMGVLRIYVLLNQTKKMK